MGSKIFNYIGEIFTQTFVSLNILFLKVVYVLFLVRVSFTLIIL